MQINLGYCCVSMLHKKLKCNRASTKTYLEKHDREACHDYLIEKAKQNLNDLTVLLKENYEAGILAFRLPEQLLPQVDLDYYRIDELGEELKAAGKIANQLGIQLSNHPSQYFVLNSLRESVVNQTIHSLSFIGEVLCHMELEKTPNLTLHLGMKKGYETVDEAINAFCRNYQRMGEAARKYLVLENDHVSFTVDECMKVHEQIGIPIVFDNKHYEWNPGSYSYEEALTKAVSTWGSRIPKLHLSSDKDTIKHAHSDYIDLADYLKMERVLQTTGLPECNVMLECKMKDDAVLRLMNEIEERRNA